MNRGSIMDVILLAWIGSAFNEAPIHESGKCPLIVRAYHLARPSMRPRFMNRGSGDIESDSEGRKTILQ